MGYAKEYWKRDITLVVVTAFFLSGAESRVTREDVLVTDGSVIVDIMPQDPVVAKFVGDNHVATCNTSDGARPRWFVGKGEPIRGGTTGVLVQDALWRGASGGLQIVISKIEKKSEGVYCCRVSEGKRAAERCFELTVKEPIVFLDTPTEQVADENSSYVVKCEVTGDPTPEIQWKVRGQPATGLSGSRFRPIADGLLISNVSVRDQGHYECAAVQMSEQVTSQQTKNISLRVRHAPKWLKFPPNTESPKYGYLTGEVNLTCAVTADPPASIRWFTGQDKQQMTEPLSSKVITEENKSTLRVKLSNSTVFGKYRCRAKNELGSIQREVLLQQGFKPKPPHQVAMTAVTSSSATLDVVAHVVGPKVQQSTHKSGTNSNNNSSSNKSANVNDTLGYRVRLTRLTNGTEYTFEQDCEPAPCRLQGLSPDSNYTMRIATLGRAGLSDWVSGPMFQTALSAAPAAAPSLAAVGLLLAAALAARRTGVH